MLWAIITVAILILIIWKGYLQPYSYWKKMGVPQTNPIILLGDAWPLFLGYKNPIEWMYWIYNLYPDKKLIGIYQFYMPFLLLKDPDLFKQIAVKDFDYFTDHKGLSVSEDVDPLWGKNLFSLKGQRWREMRSLLSGSFTSSKMRIMYTLIAEESKKFANHFEKKKEVFMDVELKDIFTRYTNDVIASTSFGIKVDSLENPSNEFFQMGTEVTSLSGFLFFMKFMGLTLVPKLFKLFNIGLLPKKASKYFETTINETIKIREEQQIKRPDMINLLLEIKKGINNREEADVSDSGFAVVQEFSEIVKSNKKQVEITNLDITSQALIFFLAGFDTVSYGMCYTCYELALNPKVQDTLRQEITSFYTQTKGKPSYEDILGMKYLDMVISESLRKWPPAPATDRICTKPYTLNSDTDIHLNKGDTILIPIYSIHHDPNYYPDPEKFIPERFSEENKDKINPYTYMPFGIGPRACIGSRFALLEIKSVLFHFLHKFEIVPTKKTQIPLKFNKIAMNLKPQTGFELGLKRISV
ncbi:unnamed protein product [Ceutorhynchus assimilis]|uniref:Cytochrome P450 n=1 Tax=Ceutorhynchus assimilis TaxID=467358 RepID=A0A9N9N1Z7_9CUCU|nr:unnamed protein product [Ceutorhynchus assimilis]